MQGKERFVFLNNRIVPISKASIETNDRGLLLGDGLFETMRTHSGEFIFYDLHLERLKSSLEILGISMDLDERRMERSIRKLKEINGFGCREEVCLRLTITRGAGGRGLLPQCDLQPTVIMSLSPCLPLDKKSFKVQIAKIRRNESSPLSRIKSLSCLDNVLIRKEAHREGKDEALVFNTQGKLVEASAFNVFLIKNNILFTPPVTDGALAGVTRKIILALSKEAGLSSLEKSIFCEELFSADEIFLTNSLAGIMPLSYIGDYEIPKNLLKMRVLKLQKVYAQYIERKVASLEKFEAKESIC